MLGASYGGYMANWIQGHNDEFRFKAIVCHDGIFDTTSAFYETEASVLEDAQDSMTFSS